MKDDYKKYEHKPYSWVSENLKFGVVMFLIGVVCYGVYKLIEYLFF